MVILKNGRREGSSVVFDENFRFDKRGNLRVSGNNSAPIPYSEILEISGNGDSANSVRSILFDGLNIPANPSPNAARRLLFIKDDKRICNSFSGNLSFHFCKKIFIG